MSGKTMRETKNGTVEGIEQGSVLAWLGIPFAKPPVGELRFRRAQPVDDWEGVRPCREFAPGPMQFAGGSMGKMMKSEMPHSEDCLYLNVWAPKEAEGAPVFIYLYGGANHVGETADPGYRLDSFARDGVVAVSIAYRLGPLGFYDFSPFSDRFDSNCAVSDVIEGLRWIQANIARFGGDPGNVTLCGESAGGSMVYCALASPAAKGLFHKAIAMSGLAGNATTRRGQSYNNGIFLEELGLDENSVDQLAGMEYEKLLQGAAKMFETSDSLYPGIFQTGAVVGDDLIPEPVWDALEHGSAKDVKCIFGTCENEGALFTMMKMVPLSWDAVERMFEFNGLSGKTVEAKKLYSGLKGKGLFARLAHDRMFWTDAVKCALAQSRNNPHTYMYRFDFATILQKVMGFGASHGSDVGPALDTWEGALAMFNKLTPKKKLQRMHEVVHGSFVAFACTGTPSAPSAPGWPAFEEGRRATFVFDQRCSVVENQRLEAYDFWKGTTPHLYQ